MTARFNERFLLSLAHCESCLVLDDELNILPISSHVRNIQKAVKSTIEATVNETTKTFDSEEAKQLYELQATMRDTQPIGSLIDACRTLDQAKAVLTFVESISEKTLRSTVALTASRGRGKSSALGLSIAGAIAYGYSNIFVTAPSPENLQALFAMILKGFDALNIKEHEHYEIIQSTNPDLNKAIVRINVFQSHRQTIQYISPDDTKALSQAELLIIDEAAAIPLPLVKALLGPYLVFMSSTINGYEGTGRSLSMKLLKQLRHESVATATASAQSTGGRTLREITLEEPIRYSQGDPIEAWMNNLLCLNCASSLPRLAGGVPHPSECELYYVERDTLFSGHAASEEFLQRMMALYVSSHYKNSPNDLQLMSDAPAHQLFVLLGPQGGDGGLPDVLAVVQVCLEGEISASSVSSSLGRGDRASGDLIPWTISQQFQTPEFASLSGARIVRIATHPELVRMGYASRAMDLLTAFYTGQLTSLDETKSESKKASTKSKATVEEVTEDGPVVLQTETLAPRASLPPLLQVLSDVEPPVLHYLGVSYGLTSSLYSFWSKAGFSPLYTRLTANSLTGEHTCIMIRVLNEEFNRVVNDKQAMKAGWDKEFVRDFRSRFLHLLGFNFSNFDASLALSLLQQSTTAESSTSTSDAESSALTQWRSFQRGPLSMNELTVFMTEFDLRRLESYADNLVDYHLIIDLLPNIALFFFNQRLPVSLSLTQQAILLGVGLQHKSVDTMAGELTLQVQQVLALFNKSMRKIATHLRSVQTDESSNKQSKSAKKSKSKHSESVVEQNDEDVDMNGMAPLTRSLDSDLYEASKAALAKKPAAVLPASLSQFAIGGDDARWQQELNGSGDVKRVSIKTDEKRDLKRKVVHENADSRKSGKAHKDESVKQSSGKKRKVKQ